MAKVSFRPIGQTENAKIFVRFTIDHTTSFRRKTDYIINWEHWSKEKNCPKQSNANVKKLATDLKKLELLILESYNTAVSNNIEITAEWLQKLIDTYHGKAPKGEIDLTLFVNYFEYHNNNLQNKVNKNGTRGVKKRTIQKYQYVRNIIIDFEKHTKRKYKLKDIDIKFQSDFITYLLDVKKYSDNYTGRLIKFVKTVCRDARFNGIETHQQLDRLQGYKVKIEKIFLTNDELEQIEKESFTREALTNAKDWLILGCYIGQRVSDLLVLTKKNITNKNGLELIELTQQKTGKKVAIPLHPKVKEIIEKRNGDFPPKISDQKFNLHIKDIAKLAGLNQMTKGALINPETKLKVYGTFEKWQLVTSHICRRSFASNFYGTIPTPLLISITGHSTEVMFLEYIGKTSTDYAQQLAEYWTKETLQAKKEPVLNIVREAK